MQAMCATDSNHTGRSESHQLKQNRNSLAIEVPLFRPYTGPGFKETCISLAAEAGIPLSKCREMLEDSHFIFLTHIDYLAFLSPGAQFRELQHLWIDESRHRK